MKSYLLGFIATVISVFIVFALCWIISITIVPADYESKIDYLQKGL